MATREYERVLELEHGSLLRGLSAPAASERPPFVSLRTGMGSLVTALVSGFARTELLLGRAAARVSRGAAGFEVELGDGECKWYAVLMALNEIGYSGWATAEVNGGDRARLADISRRMDGILAC